MIRKNTHWMGKIEKIFIQISAENPKHFRMWLDRMAGYTYSEVAKRNGYNSARGELTARFTVQRMSHMILDQMHKENISELFVVVRKYIEREERSKR